MDEFNDLWKLIPVATCFSLYYISAIIPHRRARCFDIFNIIIASPIVSYLGTKVHEESETYSEHRQSYNGIGGTLY